MALRSPQCLSVSEFPRIYFPNFRSVSLSLSLWRRICVFSPELVPFRLMTGVGRSSAQPHPLRRANLSVSFTLEMKSKENARSRKMGDSGRSADDDNSRK